MKKQSDYFTEKNYFSKKEQMNDIHPSTFYLGFMVRVWASQGVKS